MDTHVWKLGALELAAAVAKGDISALEAVDGHLERIEAVNRSVNAVTNVLADSAREAAREIDRRRANGETLGPLAGVPFTIKENIHVAGSATTHGVPAFRGAVASVDAPPVLRLRQAGAIPIGRSNMPDLALRGMHTHSQLYGETRNPWDAEKTPGGTSGGDGVAVATGMAALGLGNDSGGSIRIPAMFCGVAGLKPSYGRFPADHRFGPQDPSLSSQLFPVDGPLARGVADLRAAYEILAGPDPRDPRAVPVPSYGPPLPAPIRVGVVFDPGGLGVHPDVRASVEAAAAALRDAGYAVEEVNDVPRLADALDVYGRMIMTEFSLSWPMIKRVLTPEGCRYIEMSMDKCAPVGLEEYIKLTATRMGILRDWAHFLADYPLILGPVFTEPPVERGLESRGPAEHARVGTGMRLCTATSFVGVPAVAVPTGVTGGLPQGVQVIGGMYREDLCLDAASAIEARLGRLTPMDPRS